MQHRSFTLISLVLVVTVGPLVAQSPEDAASAVPFSDPATLDVVESAPRRHSYDYGISTVNTYLKDSALDSGLYLGYYRPFFRYSYGTKLTSTVRGRFTLTRYDQALDGVDQQTLNRSLELANVRYAGDRNSVTAGRSFLQLGSGILFANFTDTAGIKHTASWGELRATAFYSGDYSVCALALQGCGGGVNNPFNVTPNLAADVQPVNAGRRAFAAAEYTTPSVRGGRLYAISLLSKDYQDSAFLYQPWYTAVGARGFIGSARYTYDVEVIQQGGLTRNNGGSTTTNISAFAYQAEVQARMPFADSTRLNLILQSAAGSGDGDRSTVTSQSQVNTAGNDRAFFAFGGYSGGLALRPTLANLQIYRVGFSLRPLPRIYATRDLIMVVKATYYRKSNKDGVTSDALAVNASRDIGYGADVTLVYAPVPDVNLFYGFGYFAPGAAYDETEARTSHIISASISF